MITPWLEQSCILFLSKGYQHLSMNCLLGCTLDKKGSLKTLEKNCSIEYIFINVIPLTSSVWKFILVYIGLLKFFYIREVKKPIIRQTNDTAYTLQACIWFQFPPGDNGVKVQDFGKKLRSTYAKNSGQMFLDINLTWEQSPYSCWSHWQNLSFSLAGTETVLV